MKLTYALWSALFVLAWMTGGFLPAILLTALAVSSSVTTGLSVQDKLGAGSSYRELR